MYCLWNGEYGEHDLSFVPGLPSTLKRQEEQYSHYIGIVVGDFTCLDVEYDWGKRDQRWKIKCNLCGKESYLYHAQDWRRGKGKKTVCDCRKAKDEAEKIFQREKAKQEIREARQKEFEEKAAQYIGKEYFGWVVDDYNTYDRCTVRCAKCDIKRMQTYTIQQLENNEIAPCNHRRQNSYQLADYVGKKNGHLMVIGKKNNLFEVYCDCGNITTVSPTAMFVSKRAVCCGMPNCKYANKKQKETYKRKLKGFSYEEETYKQLVSLGYNAEITKKNRDFGVDIIITEKDGTKTAIQCKNQEQQAGVDSVQQVYSGGRFYDCTHFAVMSKSGFSQGAIIIARKLGVYLCDGEYNPPDDIDTYTVKMLPTHKNANRDTELYEIKGIKKTLSEWCTEYHTTPDVVKQRIKRGFHLEDALTAKYYQRRNKIYTANGISGTFEELCEKYGMIPATVRYRMKQRNMSLEDALTIPKEQNGHKANGSE